MTGPIVRVALVTGAARGIGAATVLALAEQGWAVLASDLASDDPALPYPMGSETELSTVVSEACRVLRPGGTLVLDTVNATARARFIGVTLAERIPGVMPKGLHDPDLFVPPSLLVDVCARAGVRLKVRGLRPAAVPLLRWLIRRRGAVRMVPVRSTAMLYQGWGVKEE